MDVNGQAKLTQVLVLCLLVPVSLGCISKNDNSRKFPERRLSQISNSQRLVQNVVPNLDELSSPLKQNALVPMNKKPVKKSMKLFKEKRKLVLLPLDPRDNKIIFIPQVSNDSDEDHKATTDDHKPTEDYGSIHTRITTVKIGTETEKVNLNKVYDKGKIKEELMKDLSNIRYRENTDKVYKKENKKQEAKKWIYRSKIIFPAKTSQEDETDNDKKNEVIELETSEKEHAREAENTKMLHSKRIENKGNILNEQKDDDMEYNIGLNNINQSEDIPDVKRDNQRKGVLRMANENNRKSIFDRKEMKNREHIFDIMKIQKISRNLTPMNTSKYESILPDMQNSKDSNYESMLSEIINNKKENKLETEEGQLTNIVLGPRRLKTKKDTILDIKENMVKENLKSLWRTYVKVNKDKNDDNPMHIPLEQEPREVMEPTNYTKLSSEIAKEMIQEEEQTHPTGTARRFKRNRDVGVVRGDIKKLFDRFDPFNDNPFDKFEPHSAASSLHSPSITAVSRNRISSSLQSPTIAAVARSLSSSRGSGARSFSSTSLQSQTALAARGHTSSSSSFQSSLSAAQRGRSIFKKKNSAKPTFSPSLLTRGNTNRLDLGNSRNSAKKPKDTFFGKIHKDFKINPSMKIEPVIEKEPTQFGILTEVVLDDMMNPPIRNMIPIPTTSVLKKPSEPTSPTSTLLLDPSGFENGIFLENDEDNEIILDSVDKITLEDRSFVVFDAVPDDHTPTPTPETQTSSSVRTKILSTIDADLLDL